MGHVRGVMLPRAPAIAHSKWWLVDASRRRVRSPTATGVAFALAPGDLGAEGVEVLTPEAAEVIQPGVDRPQRGGKLYEASACRARTVRS
jgi:hypothetical protein